MRALALLVLAGCFNPEPVRSQSCVDWCPPPEVCVANQCRMDGSASNFAFVTSDMRMIDTQTVATLDGWCAERALEGGLPGEYLAWVSTAELDARRKFGMTGARGWVRTDNRPFANTLADILAGNIYSPLRITEDGKTDIGERDEPVATATLANGTVAADSDCAGFPGSGSSALLRVGRADAGFESWTALAVPALCQVQAHVYCLGVGRSTMVTPPPLPANAKRAFVTKNVYSRKLPDEADTFCNNDAGEPAGSMRYRALVATSAQSVRDRFAPVPGTVWYRTDGIQLTRDMMAFEVPLEVAPDGITHVKGTVWFGAPSLVEPAAASDNCNDFTTDAGQIRTGASERSIAPAAFSSGNPASCGGQHHFYCAER